MKYSSRLAHTRETIYQTVKLGFRLFICRMNLNPLGCQPIKVLRKLLTLFIRCARWRKFFSLFLSFSPSTPNFFLILGAFVLALLALRSAPFWLSGFLRFYLCSLIQFIRCYCCWCGVAYCLPLVIFIFIVLLTGFRGILSAMVSRRSYELDRGQ